MSNIETAHHLRQMSIGELVKKISAAGLQRDFMTLPETREIWVRTPENLKSWLAHVFHELHEPWRLRCMPSGGRKDDASYFSIWIKMRDRDFPEFNPDYVPPKLPDDDSSNGAGAPPPSL